MGRNGLHVKKGDTVLIVSGDDRSYQDRRRQGQVLEAHPRSGRVVVQGVNIQVKHQRRATQRQLAGGKAERPGPIHASNVMLICPSCDQPTRVRRRMREGARVRVCRKCGKDIE